MAKKVPIRKCVGCNERKNKKELIRVVHNKDKEKVFLDKTGKAPGRGAYICPDIECLKKAKKSRKIDRSLKMSISEEIYDSLMEEIDIMKD
ncbi:MAG: RNase P modulator RnpM [Halanaerobiales bacterium]